MKTFKSILTHHQGKRIILPVDGQVQVSEDGEFNVSDECARAISAISHFSVVEKQNTPKKPEGKAKVKEEKQNSVEETKEVSKLTPQQLRAELIKTPMEELKSMCERAGLPKKNWEKLSNKMALVKYVLDNVEQ